jgi:hypothetical protein
LPLGLQLIGRRFGETALFACAQMLEERGVTGATAPGKFQGNGNDGQRGAEDRRLFRFSGRGTTLRTEVVAGATTFLTMAYIVLVNPSILGQAGMPVAAVAAATCFAAAFASC